jgi:hypothetical protein
MSEENKVKTKSLALINESDLSLVENNSLNAKQLAIILKRTPKQYVKKRPAKGGGEWEYVTGGYVKKCLNLMFGWDWDFEIVDENIMIEAKEVVVKGKLTCRSGGKTIVKMQYGNKDIMFRVNWVDGKKVPTNIPLSVGNDMKAAATDALKKCAAEIGIAADIYNKEDFREVLVDTEKTEINLDNLKSLYDEKREKLSPENQMNVERIIETSEESSYKKAILELKKL